MRGRLAGGWEAGGRGGGAEAISWRWGGGDGMAGFSCKIQGRKRGKLLVF